MDVEEARQHAATNQPNSFQPEVKRHAACDECRHRKLKCSGDKPRCGRCGRENISCVYSPQKQMGRPRKRRRDDVSSIALPPTHQYGGSGSHPIMMNDAAAATASPSTMAHMGGLSNGGVGINGHHGPFTPPAVSHQDLEALVASFDGGVSASGSNAGIPATQHHEQPLIAPPLQPQCACLSSMYLTMTSLHSLSNHDFPFVLPTLRSAINTIATVVPCPQCPKRPATATQNLHMLVSLLLTVVETVRSCLFSIDAEAARVEAAGATKAMAMADAEVPMHMHTGTPDCPARFSMELSGPDWRRFVRKALRDQIVGSPQYPVDRTLYGIVMSLENRQRRWHEDPELHRMRQKMFGDHAAQVYMVEPESRLCVKNIEHIRLAIDRLALDV
ncbi:hypothetical protein IWZ01DRAFT_430641 [Phyllosticta capitalensis]